MRAQRGRPKIELQIFQASNTRPTFSLNLLTSQMLRVSYNVTDEKGKQKEVNCIRSSSLMSKYQKLFLKDCTMGCFF